MPLTITGNGPTAGTLDPGKSLAQRMAELPNLLGAFAGGDIAAADGAAVTTWSARYGAGKLLQANTTRQPTSGLRDGKKVAVGAGSSVLKCDQVLVSGAALTIAARVWLDDPATTGQKLLGTFTCPVTYRKRSAPAPNVIELAANGGTVEVAHAGQGWADIIVSIGPVVSPATTAPAFLEVGGVSATVATGAGNTSTAAHILNRYDPDGGGMIGGVSRYLVAATAVHLNAEHLTAVRKFLES